MRTDLGEARAVRGGRAPRAPAMAPRRRVHKGFINDFGEAHALPGTLDAGLCE
jgi:hypothetical protein